MATTATKKRGGRPPIPQKFKDQRSEIAKRLKRYRELAGLSQPQLANLAEIREDEIKGFEDGVKPIPSEYLFCIAGVIGVRPSAIIGDF